VRSMYLRLTEVSSGPVQLDLFAGPGLQRRARLESALDQLRARYGTAAVFSPWRGAAKTSGTPAASAVQ